MTLVPRATGKGPADRFVGDVWVDTIVPPEAGISAGIVRFSPGAHTAWHAYALGQTLHVTEGIALVQERGAEPVVVRAGETIFTPAGVWHWHGATKSTFMVHLALAATPAGEPAVTWGEHLTDSDYTTANQVARPVTSEETP